MDESLGKDIAKAVVDSGLPCKYLGNGEFEVGEYKVNTPVNVTLEVPNVVKRHMGQIRSYFIQDCVSFLRRTYSSG